MHGKNLIVVSIIAIVLSVGAIFAINASSDTETASVDSATSQSTTDTNSEQASEVIEPVEVALEKRYLTEDVNATITLTEFGDYQCPACAAYNEIIMQAVAEYEGQVNFEYVHYPLTTIHPAALTAHQIAEAAAQQDFFAEVHDLLYENQLEWANAEAPKTTIYRLIEESGLAIDIDQLKFDATSPEVAAQVQLHIARGDAQNISAVPSFFVGEAQFEFTSIESLRSQLNGLLSPL